MREARDNSLTVDERWGVRLVSRLYIIIARQKSYNTHKTERQQTAHSHFIVHGISSLRLQALSIVGT
jgi:hypothetical protein